VPIVFELDAPEYALDSEPKPSLLMSLSSDLLPCSAIGSYLFLNGTFAPVVGADELPFVLNGTFGGAPQRIKE